VPLPRNLPGLALCALVLAALAFESARAGRLLGANRRLRAVEITSLRAAQLGNLPRAAKRRRLLAYLARRGFTGSEIGAIVKQVVG